MPVYFPIKNLVFRPLFEARTRYERRTDRDFARTNQDNKSDLLSRVRVGANLTGKNFKGMLVYQYAHNENWAPDENQSFDRSDILLAYGVSKVGDGTLIYGRQRLQFGSSRLLSPLEWNNVSFAWDGLRYQRGRSDMFFTKIGVSPRPNDEIMLGGFNYNEGPHNTLILFKQDYRDTVSDEVTVSQQLRHTMGKLKIDAEFAGQFGHRDDKRKLAGAFEANLCYTMDNHWMFGLKGAVASGGGDSKNTHAFDQIYPAAHDRFGLIDTTGWSNVRALNLYTIYNFDKKSSLKTQYTRIGLDSARDGWYNNAGKVSKRPSGSFIDPTGSRGRDVGDEFDIEYCRKLNEHQTFGIGFGVFRAGNFVRSFSNAGDRNQTWGYVQWGYKF